MFLSPIKKDLTKRCCRTKFPLRSNFAAERGVRSFMAITKKGSRRILVEGSAYRWAVRSRPTYAQALGQSPTSFAVELEGIGQTTLVVTLSTNRPDAWIDSTASTVTPSTVERAICAALRQGWRPSERGTPYVLALSTSQV